MVACAQTDESTTELCLKLKQVDEKIYFCKLLKKNFYPIVFGIQRLEGKQSAADEAVHYELPHLVYLVAKSIEDIYFFAVNTKYISSNVMKISVNSREFSDIFNT